MARSTKTETTVKQFDVDGNLLAETITTIEVQPVDQPEAPPTGMYL